MEEIKLVYFSKTLQKACVNKPVVDLTGSPQCVHIESSLWYAHIHCMQHVKPDSQGVQSRGKSAIYF